VAAFGDAGSVIGEGDRHRHRPGSTLLLYTDGNRGSGQRPGQRARPTPPPCPRLTHEPLHTLCDQLSTRMPPGSTDDIALPALRLPVR
jgi:hypothetical protein